MGINFPSSKRQAYVPFTSETAPVSCKEGSHVFIIRPSLGRPRLAPIASDRLTTASAPSPAAVRTSVPRFPVAGGSVSRDEGERQRQGGQDGNQGGLSGARSTAGCGHEAKIWRAIGYGDGRSAFPVTHTSGGFRRQAKPREAASKRE